MSYVKTGKNPLAYLGVEASTPPQLIVFDRDPSSIDKDHDIGTLWITKNQDKLWMLIDFVDGNPVWVQLYPTGAVGEYIANIGSATPEDGVLRVLGGDNINTEGINNIINIRLDDNPIIPGTLTVNSLNQGLVYVNASHTLTTLADGTDGQLLIGSSSNPPAWAHLTSSDNSVLFTFGSNSIDIRAVAPSGGGNVSQIDTDSGSATPTSGIINILGGSNIHTSGTSNIVTVALDDNVTLSGTLTVNNNITATSGDISTTSGDITASGSVTAGNGLTVSGTTTLSSLSNGVVIANASGVLSATNGTNGQLLIGGGSVPIWANLTSSDSSITITNGANSIDLTVTGGGGGGALDELDADSGTATPVAGAVKMYGSTNIRTEAASDTLNVYLKDDVVIGNSLKVTGLQGVVYADSSGLFSASQGTNNQMYIGKTGTAPQWLTPTSSDSSVTITVDFTAGTIDFKATGGGSGGGDISSLSSDSGTATPDGSGDIKIAGGDNINTSATGNTVTVNLDKSIYLPNSNPSTNEGFYYLGGKRVLHNKGGTFFGENAGNLSSPAIYNVGIGKDVLSLATGDCNVAVGTDALHYLTTGTHNVAIGTGAGINYTSNESYNVCINHGGVAGDNHTIRIGAGGYHVYIEGIKNEIYGEPVFINPSTGQLGTNGTSTDGELLIGSTGNGMRRAHLTSSDNSITIINNPGSIDLRLTNRLAFRAYQSGNVANVTGDGTTYYLGTQSVMTEEFDDGNNFYGGNGSGSECYFTAPVKGKYYFTIDTYITGMEGAAPPPPAPPVDPVMIITTKRTYQLINPALLPEVFEEQSLYYAALADMDVGDTCRFAVAIFISGAGKTIGVGANYTRVSGFLVSRG